MGPRELTIREAGREEAPIVHAIMQAAFATTASETHPSSALFETVEDVEEAMGRGGGILALREGRFVASGRFVLDEDEGWLSYARLSVLPSLQGEGIGSAMIDWLERRARDLGLQEIRVEARSQQPDNRPYYQARGYEITGYSERYGIPDIRTHLRKPLR